MHRFPYTLGLQSRGFTVEDVPRSICVPVVGRDGIQVATRLRVFFRVEARSAYYQVEHVHEWNAIGEEMFPFYTT